MDGRVAPDLFVDQWEGFLDEGSFPALSALPEDWDLSEFSDDDWTERSPLIEAAIEEVCGDHRVANIASTLLYLKRPRLIPMIHFGTPWALGWGKVMPQGPHELTLAIGQVRKIAKANRGALDEIAGELTRRPIGFHPTRIRILEAVLFELAWMRHPHTSLAEWSASFRRFSGLSA